MIRPKDVRRGALPALRCAVPLICSLAGCSFDHTPASSPDDEDSTLLPAPKTKTNAANPAPVSAAAGSGSTPMQTPGTAMSGTSTGARSQPATAPAPATAGTPGPGSPPSAAGGMANAAAANGGGGPTRDEYCSGHGPLVSGMTPQGSSGSTCVASFASRVFDHALCTCEDATVTGSFLVDGYSSKYGSDAPGGLTSAASVGTNTGFTATGDVEIGGSLVNAGTAALTITSFTYKIAGNMVTNGDLVITGAGVEFRRDLWAQGNITSTGFAQVSGSVHQPPCATLLGSLGSSQVSAPFTVPEPCACAADQLLDIDSIVAAGLAANHNSAVGLGQPGTFVAAGGADTLDLGCGRFALQGLAVTSAVTIKATGRTALFIDGDLVVAGSLGLDVGMTGEVDVFITGNLAITGTAQIGSPKRAAAVRFYVGGSGDIAIAGGTTFAANLYAPRASLAVSGNAETFGSYFVRKFTGTGSQLLHYDTAILESKPDDCPPPRKACETDLQCGSAQVCKSSNCSTLAPD